MSINTFPSFMPHPVLSAYRGSRDESYITTDLGKGLEIRNNFKKSAPYYIDAKFVLTNDEAKIFMAFLKYDANDGVSWFYIDLRLPDGLKTRTVKLRNQYKGPVPFGNATKWEFTVTFQLRFKPVIDIDTYNGLDLSPGG